MGKIEIIIAAVTLAMDAFAIGMTNGMERPKMKAKTMLLIAFLFGAFQLLMPLAGYFLTKLVSGLDENLFKSVSGWVAFFILVCIGGKMIFDSVKEIAENKKKRRECEQNGGTDCQLIGTQEKPPLSVGKLLLQAVATSIDAFALGIAMRFAELDAGLGFNVWLSVGIIGVVTFALVCAAVAIGKKAGDALADKAGLVGGVALVLLGIKSLF